MRNLGYTTRTASAPPQAPLMSLPRLDPAFLEAAGRRAVSAAGLCGFLAIADLWGLTEAERLRILGAPSRSAYHAWAKAVREHQIITLDLDRLIRVSAVLGIHQALRVLYATEAEGIAWLRGPQQGPLFAGRAPLALVTAGTQDALLSVRRFLEAARTGQYMAPNAIDIGFTQYTDSDITLR